MAWNDKMSKELSGNYYAALENDAYNKGKYV